MANDYNTINSNRLRTYSIYEVWLMWFLLVPVVFFIIIIILIGIGYIQKWLGCNGTVKKWLLETTKINEFFIDFGVFLGGIGSLVVFFACLFYYLPK